MSHAYRIKLLLCFLITLVLACGGCSTDEKKTYTIGVINFSPAADPAFDGFRQGMRDLGYVEGVDIRYIYQGHISDKNKLLAEGRRLMAEGVDLIFSMSTPATLVAREVTKDTAIPVVFGPVNDPIAAGLVTDLKHPGGNLTGITFSQQEPKRLEFFKSVIPSLKRICFPYNSKDPSPNLNLKRLQPVADKLGLELVPVALHSHEEITAFLLNFPSGYDAIYLPTDSLMASHDSDFAALAVAHKLPLSTPQREGVEAGGLLSYGFSIVDVGKQAARLAGQILTGVSPADLPVEVTEFVATINLATAQKIGVPISDSILRQSIIIRD